MKVDDNDRVVTLARVIGSKEEEDSEDTSAE
jgi:hypothetical protein